MATLKMKINGVDVEIEVAESKVGEVLGSLTGSAQPQTEDPAPTAVETAPAAPAPAKRRAVPKAEEPDAPSGDPRSYDRIYDAKRRVVSFIIPEGDYTVRVSNRLRSVNIKTIEECADRPASFFMGIPNFGSGCLRALRIEMSRRNLALKRDRNGTNAGNRPSKKRKTPIQTHIVTPAGDAVSFSTSPSFDTVRKALGEPLDIASVDVGVAAEFLRGMLLTQRQKALISVLASRNGSMRGDEIDAVMGWKKPTKRTGIIAGLTNKCLVRSLRTGNFIPHVIGRENVEERNGRIVCHYTLTENMRQALAAAGHLNAVQEMAYVPNRN